MESQMRPCHVVEIVTPRKLGLRCLWFGPTKPKRAIVWVHGLTGSAFSNRRLVDAVVNRDTAVLTFNNRGHDIISRIHRGKSSVLAGSAHEVFTDCVDDILGAINFVRARGVKEIYLAGHSTGCQKAVYYASKMRKRPLVKGLLLLAPVSDYAAGLKNDKKGKLAKATKLARKLVRAGKKHELLPRSLLTKWSIDDAQRYLSLYSPDSPETIFSYEQPKKNPRTLKSVKVPMLVVWAQKDEYADRSSREVVFWFEKHLKPIDKVIVVPKVKHPFKGGERKVAKSIRDFMLES